MALVVFIKGVNVGGHRRFRPSQLAKQLKRYDIVNVGAAGTFIVRKPVSQAKLRAELKRRLPFDAAIMICNGKEIVRLAASVPFANERADRTIMQFVTVLSKRRTHGATIPLQLPAAGKWALKVLDHQHRFVIGICRRQMKAIGYLGQVEKIFGAPATTRSWSTILSIVRVLKERRAATRNDQTV